MNYDLLQQSVTLNDILHNHTTWWVGGILIYFIGGIVFRNFIIKKCCTPPMGEDDKILAGFCQFLFPASLVIVLGFLFVASLGLSWSRSVELVMKRQAEKDKK